MRKRILLVGSALLCPLAPAAAQSAVSPWFVRVEGGVAQIHSIDAWDPAAAVGIGRYVDARRMVAVLLNAGGSSADASYATLALGVELQLPGDPRITPTLGGGAGLLLEEGGGPVLHGSAGLAYRIGADKWLRVSGELGRHGDFTGPHTIMVGFQAPL